MRTPFLLGNRIYLRALENSDLEGSYFQWLNDREVTRWMYHGIFPNSHTAMLDFFQSMNNSRSDLVLAIILEESERHIGNIGLHKIHPVFRSAEVGILIGEKDCWGKGVASEAISLIAGHAFTRLNLNRVYAGAALENAGSIKAFEKAGFIREGLSRQAYFCEGQYRDLVHLSILHSEWLESVSLSGRVPISKKSGGF